MIVYIHIRALRVTNDCMTLHADTGRAYSLNAGFLLAGTWSLCGRKDHRDYVDRYLKSIQAHEFNESTSSTTIRCTGCHIFCVTLLLAFIYRRKLLHPSAPSLNGADCVCFHQFGSGAMYGGCSDRFTFSNISLERIEGYVTLCPC